MSEYINPILFYRINRTGDPVLVVSVDKQNQNGISREFYWLAKAQGATKTHGFKVHKAELFSADRGLSSIPPSGFESFGDGNLLTPKERGNFLGGDAKAFKTLFGGSIGGGQFKLPDYTTIQKVPLLPGDDLESFKTKIGSLVSARSSAASKYAEYERSFIDVLMNHIHQATQAVSTGDTKLVESLFKGLSVGKSYTVAGFFMKGVKSAYDAIGFYRKTYDSKVRFSNFGAADLIDYITQHRMAFPASWNLDFSIVPEITKVTKKTYEASKIDARHRLTIEVTNSKGLLPEYERLVNETIEHWKTKNVKMPFAAKKDSDGWEVQARHPHQEVVNRSGKAVIVSEYGFRGDSRSPLVLMQSGGLHPNATRFHDDPLKEAAFEDKRRELMQKAQDIYGGHDNPHWDPFLHQWKFDAISVFLSVSFSACTAFHFVDGYCRGNGFVYLLRCDGAVDQQATFIKAPFHECEISMAGGVDWESVIAFRPVKDKKLADFCYYRHNNKWAEKEADTQKTALYDLMNIRIPDRYRAKYGAGPL